MHRPCTGFMHHADTARYSLHRTCSTHQGSHTQPSELGSELSMYTCSSLLMSTGCCVHCCTHRVCATCQHMFRRPTQHICMGILMCIEDQLSFLSCRSYVTLCCRLPACVLCLCTQGSLRAATLLVAGWTTRLTYLAYSRTINRC